MLTRIRRFLVILRNDQNPMKSGCLDRFESNTIPKIYDQRIIFMCSFWNLQIIIDLHKNCTEWKDPIYLLVVQISAGHLEAFPTYSRLKQCESVTLTYNRAPARNNIQYSDSEINFSCSIFNTKTQLHPSGKAKIKKHEKLHEIKSLKKKRWLPRSWSTARSPVIRAR